MRHIEIVHGAQLLSPYSTNAARNQLPNRAENARKMYYIYSIRRTVNVERIYYRTSKVMCELAINSRRTRLHAQQATRAQDGVDYRFDLCVVHVYVPYVLGVHNTFGRASRKTPDT